MPATANRCHGSQNQAMCHMFCKSLSVARTVGVGHGDGNNRQQAEKARVNKDQGARCEPCCGERLRSQRRDHQRVDHTHQRAGNKADNDRDRQPENGWNLQEDGARTKARRDDCGAHRGLRFEFPGPAIYCCSNARKTRKCTLSARLCSMDDWDQIRTAAQVARLGTVSAAAETLGVHRATVTRHIDSLGSGARRQALPASCAGLFADRTGQGAA